MASAGNEIDVALEELEARLERLRALYEQYFIGIEKLEPSIPRQDVDRRIRSLRKAQIRNTAKRFKLQNIIQRYNTYQQHWMRVCREIENGTYHRHVARAQNRFGDVPLTAAARRRARLQSTSNEEERSADQTARATQTAEDDLEALLAADPETALADALQAAAALEVEPPAPPEPARNEPAPRAISAAAIADVAVDRGDVQPSIARDGAPGDTTEGSARERGGAPPPRKRPAAGAGPAAAEQSAARGDAPELSARNASQASVAVPSPPAPVAAAPPAPVAAAPPVPVLAAPPPRRAPPPKPGAKQIAGEGGASLAAVPAAHPIAASANPATTVAPAASPAAANAAGAAASAATGAAAMSATKPAAIAPPASAAPPAAARPAVVPAGRKAPATARATTAGTAPAVPVIPPHGPLPASRPEISTSTPPVASAATTARDAAAAAPAPAAASAASAKSERPAAPAGRKSRRPAPAAKVVRTNAGEGWAALRAPADMPKRPRLQRSEPQSSSAGAPGGTAGQAPAAVPPAAAAAPQVDAPLAGGPARRIPMPASAAKRRLGEPPAAANLGSTAGVAKAAPDPAVDGPQRATALRAPAKQPASPAQPAAEARAPDKPVSESSTRAAAGPPTSRDAPRAAPPAEASRAGGGAAKISPPNPASADAAPAGASEARAAAAAARAAAARATEVREQAQQQAATRLDDQRVKQLHQDLVAERRRLNQPGKVSVEALAASLRDTESKLKKQYAGKDVDFRVVVKDGKAIVKPVVG